MKFYLAVDSEGRKQLRPTKALIEKVSKTYEQIDIPLDQDSVMHMVQDSFDTIFELEQQIAGRAPGVGLDSSQEQVPDTASESPASRQAEPTVQPVHISSDPIMDEARPLKLSGIAADGHPLVRPAWTGPQINAMFNQRSEHVQDICHAISRLHGPDLGYVAFQVAAQITSKITVIAEEVSE